MQRQATGALLALTCLACSAPSALDAGHDSGADAGFDGGVVVRDAGRDASTSFDAGSGDAGCAAAQPWDAALPDDGLEDECGACASRGGPIGGADGYANAVSRSDATVIVATAAELVDALATAVCGDVVYVDDAASIDLSAHSNLIVPAGATLASGRGNEGSAGAHIFTRTHGTDLFVLEAGVRVTGLRIEGPQVDIGDGDYVAIPLSTGLSATRVHPVEVDNCELYGWSKIAVLIASSTGHVHHNHIHHNRRDGWGYGVDVTTAGYALIEWNLFDSNRHSIASNASPYPRYIARFNVATIGNGHAFDAHGAVQGPGVPPIAGDEFHIHHNTFLLDHDDAVLLAGVPVTGAWIHHNSVAHDFGERAFATGDNVFIYANCWSGITRCP